MPGIINEAYQQDNGNDIDQKAVRQFIDIDTAYGLAEDTVNAIGKNGNRKGQQKE